MAARCGASTLPQRCALGSSCHSLGWHGLGAHCVLVFRARDAADRLCVLSSVTQKNALGRG